MLDEAVKVPSPATDAIGEAARQAGVVVSIGVNERDGGTLYNTQLLFDTGGLSGASIHIVLVSPKERSSASPFGEKGTGDALLL